MSVQMVLLPVFALIGLAFALLLGTFAGRFRAISSGQTKMKDIALGEQNWPPRVAQFGNCLRNQFELPVLFYVLVAIALPLRRMDLVLVLLSWVFVVARYAHAGVFVTSNDVRRRGPVWLAGALVLMAMWLYFALRILLLI
ncbi:MAPEG family protein [Rhodopseudomonas palustris]|uniref:MAPEG family protein n=1 Tax=Rhodopseudomonas palustris TaxID=1076 RepID=UPI0020CED032|nr:MAPEG family protein [Rhodopseudomonas palustris]MCP9626459.1 MAPEG family protein [Rhodopseudomonas palustris]